MRIERTRDAALVKAVMTHPAIYPHITEDGGPTPEHFDPSRSVAIDAMYFLAIWDGNTNAGVFMVHPHTTITYEVHTCILPAYWGEKAKLAAHALLEWMFSQTPCRKLITHVPIYNRVALRFAQQAGMRIEGINRASIMKNGKPMDQYLLGILKEELCPQPSPS